MKSEQKEILLRYLEDYLRDPDVPGVENNGEPDSAVVFDEKRIAALPELRQVINDFISGNISMQQFKELHEVKCREFPYWGFKGFSGQMQLNQFVNNIEGADKETMLREAIKLPKTEEEAAQNIDALAEYIAEKRAGAESARSLPRVASVKYVLSYFWEILDHTKWPVFYNSSAKILEKIELLSLQASEGASYLEFLHATREIYALFKEYLKGKEIKYPLWFVEHVLWKPFLSLNSSTGGPVANQAGKEKTSVAASKKIPLAGGSPVPNEWLPPVVADLNELAFDRETEWSKRNHVSPDKAFETSSGSRSRCSDSRRPNWDRERVVSPTDSQSPSTGPMAITRSSTTQRPAISIFRWEPATGKCSNTLSARARS